MIYLKNHQFNLCTSWSEEKERFEIRIGHATQALEKRIAILVNCNFLCRFWLVYIKRTHRAISLPSKSTQILVSINSVINRRFEGDFFDPSKAKEIRKMSDEDFIDTLHADKAFVLESITRSPININDQTGYVERQTRYVQDLKQGLLSSTYQDNVEYLLNHSSNFRILVEVGLTAEELGTCFTSLERGSLQHIFQQVKQLKDKMTEQTFCNYFIEWAVLKTLYPNYKTNFNNFQSLITFVIQSIKDLKQQIQTLKGLIVTNRQKIYVQWMNKFS